MADWLTIPNESVDPDSPALAALFRALRDNPVAIAEGAAGAPRMQDAAFTDNSIRPQILNNGAAWVAANVIAFGIGGVGTYAFLVGTAPSYSPGDTEAGSNLFYVGAAAAISSDGSAGSATAPTSGGISGTWRCQGNTGNEGGLELGASFGATLWVRIA